ncbi:MAG: FAD binding domain-containing protein [Terracoccus sp.]
MTAPQRHTVTVNGSVRTLAGTDPATNALDWLRRQGLTGAKEGCAEGECGACAVLVVRSDGGTGSEWAALNACLVPAAALDGQEVVTAEGLGTVDGLHPVQFEMAVRGGSQCGYCTPGFVCAMAAEYYRADRLAPAGDEAPGGDSVRVQRHECGPNGFDLGALSGNLCRCTGYRPIRDAAFALEAPRADDSFASRRASAPPSAAMTRLEGGSGTYARPADLAEALALLADHPGAMLVAGSTDWGVEVNLRSARSPFVIAIDRLPELRTLSVGDEDIELGSALSLTEVERGLDGRIPLLDQLFPQFASGLIRNGATIGGNLGTGSPIGDLLPALLALEAVAVLVSATGEREVAVADFFTGYRQSRMRPDELVRSVRVPVPLSATTAFHKVTKRRFDDISSVAAAFAVDVVDGVVRRARIGLGGVAATPIRALATEAELEGREWTVETVRTAAEVMQREGTPLDDHRASAAYRRAVLGTALLRLQADSTPEPTVEA